MRDLSAVLASLDPAAPLAQRHIWLAGLFQWIRGRESSAQAAVGRVQLLIDAVESRPETQAKLRLWWRAFIETADLTTLLADFGFAPRTAFMSEAAERLRRKLLPGTPETTDSAELFPLVLTGTFDAQWLTALSEEQLARIGGLLWSDPQELVAYWQHDVLEAITYCASQIRATGFSPELRLRMSPEMLGERPFHQLAADVDNFRAAMLAQPRDPQAVEATAQVLRQRLEACRAAAASVYPHLEAHGISIGLVFLLRQLRERVLRVRELMDCLLSASPAASATRLLSRLAAAGAEKRSLRALVTANSSLLASKVAERSAEKGEHYITRTRAEYMDMVQKAMGGGALTSLTVWMKFAVVALGLSAFWGGFWAGIGYAASFVAIQLLHCTLATKQPAMTAPAMAARLKDLSDDMAIERFVDEVVNLVRSQVAAVLGNVAVVFPCVLTISALIQYLSGHPMITAREAQHVFHSLTLLGPALLHAAFTGVLLFVASLIAGWAENWFVLHRLDSAMRYNPGITALLGSERAGRWAVWLREHISGLASNISLGLMLGLIPPVFAFFAIGIDVRHVTLSTGQLAAAAAAVGWEVVRDSRLWWCVAAIPLIGALNLTVSFYLAFRLALRAHNVSGVDRERIRDAIWGRWRRQPLRFFLPG